MKAFNQNITPIFIKINTLAILYEVDVRTIQNWAAEWIIQGHTIRQKRGNYDLLNFVRLRTDELNKKIGELQQGDATLYKLKQENLTIINQRQKLLLDKLNNTLIDAELIKETWIAEMKMLADNASALIPRLTQLLGGNSEINLIIAKEINEFRKLIITTNLNSNPQLDDAKKEIEEIENKNQNESGI